MADVRSVEIVLKVNEGETASTQEKTKSSAGSSSAVTKGQIGMIAATLAMQAVKVAVDEGVNWAEYYWNRELKLNDDYIGQRNKQIMLTQISRGISYASTVVSATASGAAIGGVAGAAVGAVIGAGTAIAQIVRSNVQGQDQQNIMIRQMNAQLDFTRSRAGWSLQAASIGEDL